MGGPERSAKRFFALFVGYFVGVFFVSGYDKKNEIIMPAKSCESACIVVGVDCGTVAEFLFLFNASIFFGARTRLPAGVPAHKKPHPITHA